MKTILLSVFCLFLLSGYSQDPNVEWVRTYNGPAETFDQAHVVAYDPTSGNIVVVGNGWDTEGGINVFVVEYNAAGDLIWDTIWDGPFHFEDVPYDVAIGSNGEVYVCGQTKTGEGYWDSDMFLIAFDTNGNLLWEDTYGLAGAFLDIAYEIRIGNDGKIYVAGNDDQGETNNHYAGGIVNRYTTAGEIDWTIHYNSATEYPYTDNFHGMDLDSDQNVLVCGSTVTLNTGYDMAAASYNQSGAQNWVDVNPGALNNVTESCLDIISDDQGNVFTIAYNSEGNWEVVKYNQDGLDQWTYILGDVYFTYEVFIDHMYTDTNGNLYFAVSGNGDIHVVKLLSDGNLGWHTIWASPSGYNDHVFELTHDNQGNLYVAGRAAFANSFYDMLLIKIDANGDVVWDVNYEGLSAQNDEAKGLFISPDGSAIYLVGYSRGATSNADLTIVKYAQTVGIAEVSKKELVLYPNPVLDKLSIQNCSADQIIHIFNSTGAEVWRGKLPNHQAIDISNLPAGFYFISSEGLYGHFTKL
jgi:uncharacterized delta-60 repeat protein